MNKKITPKEYSASREITIRVAFIVIGIISVFVIMALVTQIR